MKHSQSFDREVLNHLRSVLVLAGLICAVTQPAPTGFADESPRGDDATPERIYSGLQRGEKTQPFTVLHVKNDSLQEQKLLEKANEEITLLCFVHRLSNDDRVLFGLGLVDFYIAQNKNLASHFVLLSDDRAKIETMLRAWGKGSFFKGSLVSLSVDGAEGPGYYGLNRNVDMTVLVIKNGKVIDNLVINAPNGRDLETIMGLVAMAIGKPKPTLAAIQQELRMEHLRQQEERIKASPVFKLAPNEQLGRIMFGMVNSRGNRSKNAQRRIQQLLDWAGDSKERRIVLQNYCRSVLEVDLQLDQSARAAIQKLARGEENDAA